MKITNKLLLAGAALLASLSLVSCQDVIGGNSMIKSGIDSAKIEYENIDLTSNSREFKFFNMKHSGAVCTIAFDTVNSTISEEKGATGVMGFGFGITENENGTVNFGIAGARYNKDKKIQYYVSWMINVSKEDINVGKDFVGLNGKNSTVIDSFAKATDAEQAYEIKLAPTGSDTFLNQAVTPAEDGTVTFVVDVKIDASNKYTVKLATETEVVEGKVSAKNAFKTVEIPATLSGITYDKAVADNEKTWYQADVSYYANVYAGATLVGNWKVVDKQNNPIVAE